MAERDAEVFGEDTIVYCKSHMRAHHTGWCGVHPNNKVALKATDLGSADEECRARGFELVKDRQTKV